MLFVSHNMQTIRSLCTRVIELEGGNIVNSGEPSTVVDSYLKLLGGSDGEAYWSGDDRPGDADVRLSALRIVDMNG